MNFNIKAYRYLFSWQRCGITGTFMTSITILVIWRNNQWAKNKHPTKIITTLIWYMLVKSKNNDISYQGKKVPTNNFLTPTSQILNDSTVLGTFNRFFHKSYWDFFTNNLGEKTIFKVTFMLSNTWPLNFSYLIASIQTVCL